MNPPVKISARRKIFPEMAAAALLAPKGGAGDQSRNRQQVKTLPGFRMRSTAIHRLSGFCVGPIEFRDGLRKAAAGSEQACTTPHQGANSLGLLQRLGARAFARATAETRDFARLAEARGHRAERRRPLGAHLPPSIFSQWSCCGRLLHGVASASAKHQSLEERVAGEAVCAVNAG